MDLPEFSHLAEREALLFDVWRQVVALMEASDRWDKYEDVWRNAVLLAMAYEFGYAQGCEDCY